MRANQQGGAPLHGPTAFIVDGGFYRVQAQALFGYKTPSERAHELWTYCMRHLKESHTGLYRILYYDCPPSERVVFHPLTRRQVNLAQTDQYRWMKEFLREIIKLRKVALRRGEELQTQSGYALKPRAVKDLCSGKRKVSDLQENDFRLDITQKGVDMRIGLDIASLAQQRLVSQIVMISGDSDFVPAAKLARRSGIDFVLDPMWHPISPTLDEHIDGVHSCVARYPANVNDPLHAHQLHPPIEERADGRAAVPSPQSPTEHSEKENRP